MRILEGVMVFAVGMGMGYVLQPSDPRPCISNQHFSTYPVFDWEQEALDFPVAYDPSTEWYRNLDIRDSAQLARYMINHVYTSHNGVDRTEIYTNPRTGREFVIPALCYYEVDSLGNPVLYRKD